jgi:hypothetical protein
LKEEAASCLNWKIKVIIILVLVGMLAVSKSINNHYKERRANLEKMS